MINKHIMGRWGLQLTQFHPPTPGHILCCDTTALVSPFGGSMPHTCSRPRRDPTLWGLWNNPRELGVSLLLSGMEQRKGMGRRLELQGGADPHLTHPQPQVYCGRYINGHMLQHHGNSGHPLVLSYIDLSTWCYYCQAYVHHQVGPG